MSAKELYNLLLEQGVLTFEDEDYLTVVTHNIKRKGYPTEFTIDCWDKSLGGAITYYHTDAEIHTRLEDYI